MKRSKGLSGKLLPVHFKPKEDELLSSWICRLALAHGLISGSLCSSIIPGRYSKQVFTVQDIDAYPSKKVINILAEKTGTPINRVITTTLSAYAGFIVDRWAARGPLRFVLPITPEPRMGIRPGLQYCPMCLAEAEPYYKRIWRLAFITICTKHRVQLLDRCTRCAAPVSIHKAISNGQNSPPSDRITFCYSCKADLRKVRTKLLKYELDPISDEEVSFQISLEEALREGWIKVSGNGAVYSLLYFPVLHHLIRLLVTGDRAISFREGLSKRYGKSTPYISFARQSNQFRLTHLGVSERRKLMAPVRRLLTNWPDNIIDFCSANKIYVYELRGRFKPAPFWFWRGMRDYSDNTMPKPHRYFTLIK
jgi:hypothetical protein